MASWLRPFLPYLAAGVLIAGAIGYIRMLQADREALRSQLGRKTQEVVALQESLRVVDQYESSAGALRQLWASADEPATDTLSAPDSAQGRAVRRVEATVKSKSDTLSGRSSGAEQTEDGEYVHTISGARHEGRVWVQPPGKAIRYRIRVLPRLQSVSLVQTEDKLGVTRTYVDAPRRLSVESLSAVSSLGASGTKEKSLWFSGFSAGAGGIARPDGLYGEARVGASAGIRLGAGLRLSAELSVGVETKIQDSSAPRPITEAGLFLRW